MVIVETNAARQISHLRTLIAILLIKGSISTSYFHSGIFENCQGGVIEACHIPNTHHLTSSELRRKQNQSQIPQSTRQRHQILPHLLHIDANSPRNLRSSLAS